MITELKAHIRMQNKEKQVSGSAYSNKNFLFCNEIGEPYNEVAREILLDETKKA